MVKIFVPQIMRATVSRDGLDVLVVMEGGNTLKLQWEAALEVSKAMRIQAKRIEEQVKAESIIQDQAILFRSGAPFGLSNNPHIISEARKEAINNRDLRRYIQGKRAGGIGKGIVGKPTVILQE